MLREFAFDLDNRFLKPILEQFEIKPRIESQAAVLLEFKILTPDSFIWKFLINNEVYYLYAEDYIESKESLLKSVTTQMKSSGDLELIPSRKTNEFEYKHLPEGAELQFYAVESGYDHVFLVKSNENPSDAYFNE